MSNVCSVYNSIEMRDDDVGILFLLCRVISFFCSSCIELSKNFQTRNLSKLESFQLRVCFSMCNLLLIAVMCSLVRPANYLGSIRRFPVKTYLARSPNQNFKYLGSVRQVKLIFFPCLLF